MESKFDQFIELIKEKELKPMINLDRPIYIQPEDSIKYRAARIIIICGMLSRKNGLSKKVISSVDFLLRNTGFQKTFIISYFRGKKNLFDKLKKYTPSEIIETDFNIIQYKSVPWDLRFNDMFFCLYISRFIEFHGEKEFLRIKLTDNGLNYFEKIKNIFIDEVNFLELFGKQIQEEKLINVITEVIPNTYWRENEKLVY